VPARLDLLARDAACAAEARARNAGTQATVCPDSTRADVTQALELIAQARDAGTSAVTEGTLRARQANRFDRKLGRAAERLASLAPDAPPRLLARHLAGAVRNLARACRGLTAQATSS
jgi:hypothetical protein